MLMLLSCATTPNAYREIDIAVERSDFRAAIEAISRGAGEYSRRNTILLYLDKGLLEHYAGDYAGSSNDLQNAERLIEEAYTKSISESFLSYIVNDNAKEYPGEDFEDIYINVFNALNYYSRGNIEGALVEIRKLSISNGKLDMLARKYEYTDPNTGVSLTDTVQRETGVSQLPETKTVNFSNSALARFLAALFYQVEGNADSARIEFDQLNRAFTTNRNIYHHPVPTAVEDARNVPPGKARLNVISFTGLSPIKQEAYVIQYLPFQHPILATAVFKLPRLINRPSVITRIEVVVNGEKFDLELLEDMGAVVEETFNARYSNILLKTYIRTILKYAVADIAAMEVTKQQGELAGFLTAAAARTGLEISESADTRMSRYLPGRAYIGGVNLDPGTYSVIINYYQGNNVITRAEYKDIIVNPNRLNLLESVNLR
ncbi:MAG: hypothetical protein LBQ89_02885 [Treponema sp.]|nr:hypothetical protein [Treponema sp.]